MDQNNTTKKSNFNKTWILVAGLVILTAVLLVISINAKNSIYKPSAKTEAKKDIAHTSLEFSTTPRVSSVSGTYDLDINIITNQDKVTVTQLEMTYDPKQLTRVDIKPGTFIDKPDILQKSIDPVNGRIKYWLGIQPSQKGISGQGIIATVSFTKVGSGTAQIIFLPKTSVSANGIDQSVLKTMVSGYINNLPSFKILPTKNIIPTISK